MNTSFKELVRQALSKASDDRCVSRMCRELAIAPTRAHQFISKGSLNTDEVVKLAGWLRTHGYLTSPLPEAFNDPSPAAATAATASQYGSLLLDAVCPECHQRTPGFFQGALYCCQCGAPLGPRCACGTVNLPNSKYCRECGNTLATLPKQKGSYL